jgi:hypothetical protein
LTKSYNNEVGFMTGPWDAPGIDYFDASLGTLTGVRIDYSAFVVTDILGAYWDDVTGDFLNTTILYNIAGNRSIALNGSLFSFNFDRDGSYLYDPSADSIGYAVFRSDTFEYRADVSEGALSNFIGDGAITPETDLSYRYTKLGEVFPEGAIGMGGYSDRESAFIETLTVTYTYATAAVPEPASWGLMVIGFGAVGSTMRRRRAVFA